MTPAVAKKKQANTNPIQNAGYMGTLPDVTGSFQQTQENEAAPLFESVDSFDKINSIKPTPTENPAFINIIQKRDKNSKYINELQDIIPILEQIDGLISRHADTQHFNAAATYLNENVSYLRDKYRNKSESSLYSFKKMVQVNMQVQTVANLRSEREIYKPYLASGANGYIYSGNVVSQQLEYLLSNIEEAILILKEAR